MSTPTPDVLEAVIRKLDKIAMDAEQTKEDAATPWNEFEEGQRRLRALQEREVALKERTQFKHEQDVAAWPERQRVVMHHDVLLKMLELGFKEGLSTMENGDGPAEQDLDGWRRQTLEAARTIADLAYPPPTKETP